MSEHEIEVVSDSGELSLRLVCHAVKGAQCRMRPSDPDVEEWGYPYDGEMIDVDCWAVEYVSASGFEDGIRSEADGAWVSIPVAIGYDEGVTVEPVAEHSVLAGLDTPEETP